MQDSNDSSPLNIELSLEILQWPKAMFMDTFTVVPLPHGSVEKEYVICVMQTKCG